MTTKHAITGLSKTLSLDGRPFDIGNAESAIVADLKENQPDMETIDISHSANAVFHMADLPLSANVQSMTVMATKMPFVGRS